MGASRSESPDLGYLVHRTSRLLKASVARETAPLGLTPQQAAVILNVADDTPSAGELAERLGMDRPTMTGVLERLSSAGLIEVETNPADKRSRLVALTGTGRELRPLLLEAARAASEPALDALDHKERKALAVLLLRVSQAVDAHLTESQQR